MFSRADRHTLAHFVSDITYQPYHRRDALSVHVALNEFTCQFWAIMTAVLRLICDSISIKKIWVV